MKINLPNITLVAVACVRVQETIKAIEKSCSGINFGSVKLITHEDAKGDIFETVYIDPLNYENYNRFIVFDLHKYIETEFALIIQDDGFVTGPNQWRKEFLDYDYIGAPWPLPTDDFSYRDPFGNLIRVGNGGFSLRSKKILSLPTKLNLEWRSYFGFF